MYYISIGSHALSQDINGDSDVLSRSPGHVL